MVWEEWGTPRARKIQGAIVIERFWLWWTCIIGFSVFTVLTCVISLWFLFGAGVFALLSLQGLFDFLQTTRSVARNWPILGRFRYFAEELGQPIHQYFVESNTDGKPFSRDHRSVIYRRARNIPGVKAFGTEHNPYDRGYEWIQHSISPRAVSKEPHRLGIGGDACQHPYTASILNISGMSYGALSSAAVEAMNLGAKKGDFFQNTGEGGVSVHHLKHGGDLCWQIGSGYFGCRGADGKFDRNKFAEVANLESVKLIEIKISQGAKPGHGGMLPASKITPTIAAARGIPVGQDCISPAYHTAFSTPRELCQFIQELRELSGGKPVGFKLCVGSFTEFLGICKAMIETQILPDFIVVDGGEGGTGAAPLEFSDHLGAPLVEGLVFLNNALVGTNLRDKIRVGASGLIHSAHSIVKCNALGADWVNAARAFMMTVGCIQAQRCNTNSCPVGVATQDPRLARAIHVPLKADRVFNYHVNTMHALAELTAAAGLGHPTEFTTHQLFCTDSSGRAVSLATRYPRIKAGELLAGTSHVDYRIAWEASDPDSFNPTVEGRGFHAPSMFLDPPTTEE